MANPPLGLASAGMLNGDAMHLGMGTAGLIAHSLFTLSD
jgi:hypothetical protein